MDESGINFDNITHPLTLHLRYICSIVSATWEYLEYLSSELLLLVSFDCSNLGRIAEASGRSLPTSASRDCHETDLQRSC